MRQEPPNADRDLVRSQRGVFADPAEFWDDECRGEYPPLPPKSSASPTEGSVPASTPGAGADHQPTPVPGLFVIQVRSVNGSAWPIVEQVPGGYRSGDDRYPNDEVLAVRPYCVWHLHERTAPDPDPQEMRSQLAALVDRYYRGTDPDTRTRLENLAGLLRTSMAANHELTRDIAHYLAEAEDADDKRREAEGALGEALDEVDRLRDEVRALGGQQ